MILRSGIGAYLISAHEFTVTLVGKRQTSEASAAFPISINSYKLQIERTYRNGMAALRLAHSLRGWYGDLLNRVDLFASGGYGIRPYKFGSCFDKRQSKRLSSKQALTFAAGHTGGVVLM